MAAVSNNVAGRGFSYFLNSADATANPEVVPAVAGQSHYITGYIISNATANYFWIKDEDANTLLGPIFVATNDNLANHCLNPIKVAAGKAIHIDAQNATALTFFVEGYTE